MLSKKVFKTKNSACKKFIQYSENFQGNSVFQVKRKVAQKSWMVKIFQYCEKFQGKFQGSVFQCKRKLLKNSEW